MRNKKHILYITYDGLTDPLGQSQIIPYLNGLSMKGYNIIIISFEKPNLYKNYKPMIRSKLADGILWHPLRYHKNPSLPATFLDLITGTLVALFYLHKKNIHLLHCRGHFVTTMIASFILKFNKIKFLFDMRGFWADERIEGKIWSLDNSIHSGLYKFIKRHEKYVIRKSDHIVVLTNKAKEYLCTMWDVCKKTTVIPCMTDLELFTYRGDNVRKQMRLRYGLDDQLVLTYLGSLGTWYMTEEIMDFYGVLRKSHPATKLMFLTKDDPSSINELLVKKNIPLDCVLIKSVHRTEIPDYLSASDAGIFFIRPTFSKIASSPTKHGEFLACGLPIVSNSRIGDMDEIVSENKTGIIITEFNQSHYHKAVDDLLNLIKDKERVEISNTAKTYYDLNQGITRYMTIYDRLLEIDQ